MASVEVEGRPNRYAHHVLWALSLSTLYLGVVFSAVSIDILRTLLSFLGVIVFAPLLGFSLFGMIVFIVYSLIGFVLILSYYLQRKTLRRPQLVAALIVALVAGAVPVTICLQTGEWPFVVVPFVLLQIYLAVASFLESNHQLSLQT